MRNANENKQLAAALRAAGYTDVRPVWAAHKALVEKHGIDAVVRNLVPSAPAQSKQVREPAVQYVATPKAAAPKAPKAKAARPTVPALGSVKQTYPVELTRNDE